MLWKVCDGFAVLIGSGVYWTKNISLFLFSLDADKQRFDIRLTICIHSHGHSLPFAMFHVPYQNHDDVWFHRLHGTQMIYTLHRQNQRFFSLKIICRLWFEIRWFRVYFLRFFHFSSIRFNRLSSRIEHEVSVQQTLLWVTVASRNFQHPR